MSNKSYVWWGFGILAICAGWIVFAWLIYDTSLIVKIALTLLWGGLAMVEFFFFLCPTLSEIKSDKIQEKTDNFNYLKTKINNLENYCIKSNEKLRKYIEVVKCRDYLIRTKFVGSLTNKKLIKQWKENMDGTDFKESVIDFDIHEDKYDYFLEDLKVLRELEVQQNILDLYTEKPKKATSASNGSKNIANKNSIKKEKKDNE